MDVRKIKLKDSYEFEPCYPNGGKTGVVFSLRSPSCKEAERVRRKWDNVASRQKKGLLTFDQKKESTVEMMAACIAGWRGLEEDGKPLEFSQENLADLMGRDELKWLFDAVAGEIMDGSVFLSLSGGSSPG